jgi:hypothetical protein
VADERSDGGFELLDIRKAAFEKFARRVIAGGKIRSGRKEWHRLRQRHRVTP